MLPEQAWSTETDHKADTCIQKPSPSQDPGEISRVSYQFKQESVSEWPVGFAEWQEGKGIVLSRYFCTHEIKYMFEGDIVFSFLGITQKLLVYNLELHSLE